MRNRLVDTSIAQTLTLAGGGTDTGSFTLANSGSVLAFGGGTHNLSTPVSIPASATLNVTGGTVSVNTNLTAGTLNLSGGSIAGAAMLTAGTLNWTGGSIAGAGGGVSVSNTVNVNGGATTLTSGAFLTNNGTAHYQPTAAMAKNAGQLCVYSDAATDTAKPAIHGRRACGDSASIA